MEHQFNDNDLCPRCGTHRHYVAEVGKYIYTSPLGSRTFVETKCLPAEKDDGRDYSLLWEVIIFILVCAGIYLMASIAHDRREQQRIEEYHSYITPETANDTL